MKHPVERYRGRFFSGKGDDATWKEWVDHFQPNWRALVDFVADPKNKDVFKARALVVLLAPDARETPVYWKDGDKRPERGSTMLTMHGVPLEKLPLDLMAFTADLVVHACERLSTGRMISEDRATAIDICNGYIVDLLASPATADSAERLWSCFDINDAVSYSNMESASGYTPWLRLMGNPNVPAKWKLLADKRLREVIDAELAGDAKARHEWEKALDCYIRHIATFLFRLRSKDDGKKSPDHGLPYDVSLLADQLHFLLSRVSIARVIVEPFNMAKVLTVLQAPEYRELCVRLIRHSLNAPAPKEFRAYSEETLQAARMMLMMSEGHPGLTQRISTLIEGCEQGIREESQQQKGRGQQRKAILAKMRI